MSHFTVLVVGDDPETQLIPFQENNMGDCPEEYLEFCEAMENVLCDYRDVRDQDTGEWTKNLCSKCDDDSCQECLDLIDMYAADQGYKKHDGKWGYWENPNAKWDWYSLGGRWNGFFRLKPGRDGQVGEASFMHPSGVINAEPLAAGPNTVDSAKVGDIDFEAITREAEKEAGDSYDNIQSLFGGEIPKLEFLWKDLIARDDIDWDEKRRLYSEQPGVVKADKVSQDNKIFFEMDNFQCSREEYVSNAGRKAFTTFAVLKDGQWYERGEMGWWACVSNEKDRDAWSEEFNKLLRGLPDDTLVSVYDCHI